MSAGWLEPIRACTWRTFRFEVRNTKNTFARSHPMVVFWAMLKFALRRMGSPDNMPYVFHSTRGPFPRRIRKNAEYGIEVVFPTASVGHVMNFSAALQEHLADPAHHFKLLSMEPVGEESLAELLEASPVPDDGETCLEFESPFPFTPRDKKRRYLLEENQLLWLLVHRVRQAWDIDLDPPDGLQERFRFLSYYWDYHQISHKAKSGDGGRKSIKYFNGCVGPAYMKGGLAELWPLILLCSRVHACGRRGTGLGFFRLHHRRAFFDPLLGNPSVYQRAWEELLEDHDESDEFVHVFQDAGEVCRSLAEQVGEGEWRPEPARLMSIEKPRGGVRHLSLLSPRDQVVQKSLLRCLTPVFDRMFESASFGFRPGRSVAQARRRLLDAIKEGYTHALESDIESFFDTIDWQIMEQKLVDCLPTEDRHLLGALRRCMRQVVEVDGRCLNRVGGLLQGSPLSPLLSNLYLDGFDERLQGRGYPLVRFGDDFIVLTRTRKDAERALLLIQEEVGRLNLRLKEDKTAIARLEDGFRFLGFDFSSAWTEELVERSTLRKALFVQEHYAMVGLRGNSLEVRRGGKLIQRVPLNRVGELVIFGNNGVSCRLIQRCARLGVPITFSTSSGYHVATMQPDHRGYYRLSGEHAVRHAATRGIEQVLMARVFVQAKIQNYLAWFRRARLCRRVRDLQRLKALLVDIDKADTVDRLRGYEGQAAKICFHVINRRVRVAEFKSTLRVPHEKPDAWNALLDFCYYLLFTRINVLVRSMGLNPYLGFLHSPKVDYESLVCDLEEAFRARIDDFALGLVNGGVVRGDQFGWNEERRRYGLDKAGASAVIQAFEREWEVRMDGDPGSFRHLVEAQVLEVRRWVRKGRGIAVYRSEAGVSIDAESDRPLGFVLQS